MVVNKEEKTIVKEAVKDLFVKYYVRANGISTTLKILLGPEEYGTIKNIISNAIQGKIKKEDKNELNKILEPLRPEVRKKIIDNIVNGEKLFLEILYNEMLKKDPQEFEKLTQILSNIK